jgi:hypothetical protein
MKKLLLTAFTVLTYSFNASALLIQPVRSNEVSEFELSLQIASKSLKHKKAWAKVKFSQKKTALALKQSPAAPLALDSDTQKREIAAFERKIRETAAETQAATGSSNAVSSVQESNQQQSFQENSIPAPQEQASIDPLPEPPVTIVESSVEPTIPEPPAPEPPVIEPPVVVNENANEHANNNAQNNSSTESSSQNNSSNGSENSNAGGKKK